MRQYRRARPILHIGFEESKHERLKNQLADLKQQIDDAKKLQDKAEQDRADAVKKLEDIENYQKGLFRH